MSKLRWAKWFWADWSNDTALNLCSIPARGLWMALLCLAAQGEPYGTVTIKGRIPSDDELFDLTCPRHTRRRDFDRWLAELEKHGVAQRDHRRAIWSPRMSHSGAISLARMDAAHAGWKDKENSRNPRNLHDQKRGDEAGLHEQTGILHEVESDSYALTDSPLSPPSQAKGGRRARGVNGGGGKKASRNEACDMLAEELHAQADDPPPGGAPVVPFPGRAHRREHH